MDPFKPYGTLRGYIYSIQDNALYIDASVTVLMPAGETLASRNAVYNPATHSASRMYDHVRSLGQLAHYNYTDNFRVEIIKPVTVPYTPNDQSGFITSLRQTMASSYAVTCVVNTVNNDASTGGSSTNTIENGGTISIL